MPNKTQNYQLNQYLPQDDFLRTDFNEDNAKIDGALGSMCKMKTAVYTGTGVAQTISLGATPKAVIVRQMGSASTANQTGEISCIPIIAVTGSTGNVIRITENGFSITDHGLANYNAVKYLYIAFF